MYCFQTYYICQTYISYLRNIYNLVYVHVFNLQNWYHKINKYYFKFTLVVTVTFSQSTYNVLENSGFANIVVQIISGTVEKDIIVRYGLKIYSNFFMIIFM